MILIRSIRVPALVAHKGGPVRAYGSSGDRTRRLDSLTALHLIYPHRR